MFPVWASWRTREMLSFPHCTSSAQIPPILSLSSEDWLEHSNWVNIAINVWSCAWSQTASCASCSQPKEIVYYHPAFMWLLMAICRPGPFFHKDIGWGQPGALGGSVDAAVTTRGWELGCDGHQENVALWKCSSPYNHRQVCSVSGCFLPGVPAGQWQADTPKKNPYVHSKRSR